MDMHLDFDLRGRPGHVRAQVVPSTGPSDSGLSLLDPTIVPATVVGLPVCTATVRYDGVGYAAAMGWVQFVRSSDSDQPDVFELDPLALFAGVDTPYAFFGIAPTLFDAPYRDPEDDVVWLARSYLAVSADAVMTRQALPVLGFSWGFRIDGGHVTLEPLRELDVACWADHLDVLQRVHPRWLFRA